jgi:hypothetical protein
MSKGSSTLLLGEDTPSEPTIHLTDPGFETASVVREFLQLASDATTLADANPLTTSSTLSLSIFLDDPTVPKVTSCRYDPTSSARYRDPLQLVPLLLFLRKWECVDLLRVLVGGLKGAITDGCHFPLRAYIAGARAGLDEICRLVVSMKWDKRIETQDPWWRWDWGEQDAHYPWAPDRWTEQCWWELTDVPRVYVATLLQVATGGGRGWARARAFDRLIERYTEVERGRGRAPRAQVVT